MPKVTFTLNGEKTAVPYEVGMHFLEVLRDECGITSPKDGCAPQGYCGCCAVLVDRQPVLSCLRKPEQMEGREVVTLEGIPEEQRRVLAQAFVQDGAIQCGYCIPGIVVRASAMLEKCTTRNREAVAKALSGHLCRCTGYDNIIRAVLDMAAQLTARGHSVTLLTFDPKDVPETWSAGGPGLPRVHKLEGDYGQLAGLNRAFTRQVAACLDGADVVHMHVPWDFVCCRIAGVANRLGVPYVVALHGMLDDWCMDQSRWKKRLDLA
ncbi:MAG: glycosyltransferase, partial [Acidobacteria bacterium]|nr:glycosyltransferase [Acidobacteriota bacterium]